MSDCTGDAGSLYDRYWAGGVAGWHVSANLSPAVESLLLGYGTDADVLDYGGGDGSRYGDVLHAASATYTVADVSREVLKRREAAGVSTVPIDQLDSRSDLYDVVVCFEVLEHLLDPTAAVARISRVTREGGTALLSVPNAFSALNRIRMLVGRQPSSGVGVSLKGKTYQAPHVKFFDLRSFANLAASAGLRVAGAYTDKVDGGRYFDRQFDSLKSLNIERGSSLFASTLFLVCKK